MYNNSQRTVLLQLARNAIRYGLDNGKPLTIDPDNFEEALKKMRACFVTLHLDGSLRGCIGSLEAYQPLIEDIAQNAYSAAFRDPRFSPLTKSEFDSITIDLSILTPASEMHFDSEANLLEQIRPNIDGLIIEDQGRRGTFLPSVWEQLPDKTEFLTHLKIKAGLSPQHWSNTLKMSRYETESFG
ncbi:MAG: AmmeMemoRadiSam system protein A [Chromatiales bacterium]|nr:AmmeMemoRadiSam system protein A [Chromatiales bacterium]